MFKILITVLFLFPIAAFAQNLQEMANTTLEFIDGTVIPFLLGIGFLFFMANAIRFFVYGSGEEDGREKAKNLAIYSVLGFVLIVVFWGIINLITSSIGLDCQDQPEADFFNPDAAEDFRTNPCGQSGSGSNQQTQNNPGNSVQPPQNVTNSQGNVACSVQTTSGGNTTIMTSPGNCADIQAAGPVNLNTVTGNGQMQLNDPSTWLGGIIQTLPRPWRDYFWADPDWNQGGGNNNNSGSGSGATNNIGSGSVNGSGNNSVNLQLQDCTYTDPQTRQLVTIQTTPQDCLILQGGGTNNAAPRPAPVGGGNLDNSPGGGNINNGPGVTNTGF